MPDQLIVIINASAGSDDDNKVAAKLTEMFRSSGVEARITLAASGEELIATARRAVEERPRAIVAGGGDGTISAVASTLVGTEIALGVLPLGTLNHFAKDLHIPLELEQATRNIIAGHVIEIDVGEVNERIFINNSSLGLYPRLVHRRERQQEELGRGKWPAFVWAALTVLRRYPFLSVRLSADGKDIVRRTPLIFIGNNQYEMEGLNIGKRARLNAGQLSLFMPHHTGRLGLLRLGLQALFGKLREARDFDALCASEIQIETRHQRLRVATDGEVSWMDAPLRYRILPGALHVIVPEDPKPEDA